MATATPLGAFCNQLIRFFEELSETFPEEREIRMGLETIQGAKKINPKLILDLFYEHVYKEANDYIQMEDDDAIVKFAHAKIATQFNEMSPALLIFDKHWVTMTEANRSAVWKYMKVLCLLCAKAKGISTVEPLKK
jgi:DNA repair protein RadC